MRFAQYESPLGPLVLQSDGSALTGLRFGKNNGEEAEEDPVLERAKHWLDGYFRGEVRPVDVPLQPEGTQFQRQVWELLEKIPYGTVRTYGDLAREMAACLGREKMSAQAIGQAVGKNPICIIVPCHRVVGKDGKLTGFRAGLAMKRALLEREGVCL